MSWLLAAAASFMLVLGFVVHNEDLKFAGFIALLSTVVMALTRRLVKMHRDRR